MCPKDSRIRYFTGAMIPNIQCCRRLHADDATLFVDYSVIKDFMIQCVKLIKGKYCGD